MCPDVRSPCQRASGNRVEAGLHATCNKRGWLLCSYRTLHPISHAFVLPCVKAPSGESTVLFAAAGVRLKPTGLLELLCWEALRGWAGV